MLALFSYTSIYGQQYGIKLDIDEFTSDTVLVSDWMVLNDPIWKAGRISYIKISKLSGQLVLHLKITTGGDISLVDKGDKFYIKFANDEVVQFENEMPVVSIEGGGAIKLRGSATEGLTLLFNIDQEHLNKLAENEISKVRVTTSSGNIEVEPEKSKYKKEMLNYFKYYKKIAEDY